MIQQVIYELGLKDKGFTSGVLSADGAVNRLDKNISGLIAKGFALFAGFDFLKSTVADFNAAEQASAQLNASLRSTGNIAGLNRKALDDQAAALMNTSLFDDDDITRAQSILATFTNIRGEVFMNTIPAVADLATKMGTDLKGAVLQVGKALQDTSGKGLSMLKRSGVDFSESQLKVIKSLFETGQVAKAQSLILKELQIQFGGSALAASQAGTGPFTVLQHQFQNVKEEIGEMAVALGLKLMPYLRSFVDWTKRAVEWVQKNSKVLKDMSIALAAVWGSFKLLSGASAIMSALGMSMTATLGPIGLVAAAVGALVFSWNSLSLSIADAKKKQDEFYEPAYAQQKGYLESKLIGKSPKDQKGVLDDEAALLSKQIKEKQEFLNKIPEYKIGDKNVIDYINEGGIADDVKELFTGKNKAAATNTAIVIANLKSRLKATQELQSAPAIATGTPMERTLSKQKAEKTKATGAKSVTINVDIRELIGIKEFNTTNIKEGIDKVKDAVVSVMTGAVNDFQIVAAGSN